MGLIGSGSGSGSGSVSDPPDSGVSSSGVSLPKSAIKAPMKRKARMRIIVLFLFIYPTSSFLISVIGTLLPRPGARQTSPP